MNSVFRLIGCGLLTLLALQALPISASVLRVDGIAGADGAGCGSEVSPCATIQQAVDLASSGDTILVGEGTYTGNVDCLGAATVVCVFQKELTILGGFGSGNWSLPNPSSNTTVIDGQNVRRGVVVRRGGTSPGLPATSLRMEGFSVRRGLATGSPHGLGGGLWANIADLVLRDMVFEDNVAEGGTDGLGGGGGVVVLSDTTNILTVTLERILFRGNQATGGGGTVGGFGQGGGLLVGHSILTGSGLDFQNNVATGGGSATAGRDGLGGAVALTFGTDATLQNVTATGNQAIGGAATDTGGHGFGGAVYVEGAESSAADVTQVEISDSRLTGNMALGADSSTAGGGIGGGVSTFGARLTFERNLVIANRAEGGIGASTTGSAEGGGLALWWTFASASPVSVIRNSIVAENVIDGTAGGGAGLRVLGGEALISHATFAENELLGVGFGPGVLVGPFDFGGVTQAGELTLEYSILADHTVPASGSALFVQATASAASTADLTNPSHFVGNGHHTNEGGPNAGTYVGFPGSNVFDSNPSTFFVDPASSDFHVDGTQPPTNSAGGSSEGLDVDGAPRSGTRDFGADEFGAVAFALSVAKVGVGSGTVTSSPSGILCGAECFQSFAQNTTVTLTPSPDGDSTFTGWSGAADCIDGSLLMNQDLQCTAQFEGPDAVPPCSVGDDHLVLSNQTVTDTRTEEACFSITAGPSYTVAGTGDVTFEAPTIILGDGFSVVGSFAAISNTP